MGDPLQCAVEVPLYSPFFQPDQENAPVFISNTSVIIFIIAVFIEPWKANVAENPVDRDALLYFLQGYKEG